MFWFPGHKACEIFSSLTRDWTHTSCIGRQSLNHWTIMEDPLPAVVYFHIIKSTTPDSFYCFLCQTLCYWSSAVGWTPILPGAASASWMSGQRGAETVFADWRMGMRVCCKDTFSPKGGKLGEGLRGKGKICLWGKGWWFPGIANMCAAPLVPLDTALIVPNKIHIPSLDWDLGVVMKLRQLSDPSWFPQRRHCSCS